MSEFKQLEDRIAKIEENQQAFLKALDAINKYLEADLAKQAKALEELLNRLKPDTGDEWKNT